LSFQGIAAKVAVAVCAAATFALAQPNPDHPHGSRAPAVHRIPLVSYQKTAVKGDANVPFSVEYTCMQCHGVHKMRSGWHFNAIPAQKQAYRVEPSGTKQYARFTLALTLGDQTAEVSYTAQEQSLKAAVKGLVAAVQAGQGPWQQVVATGDGEKVTVTAKEPGVEFKLVGKADIQAPTSAAATQAAASGKKPNLDVKAVSDARPYPPSGRPGEPWVLADRITGTQLPLSYRPWKGVYSPRDIKMTNWRFAQRFGRQFPGGGVGTMDAEKETEPDQRWELSGKLEIHCQACHSGSFKENMSHWALNVDRGNFKWAAVASSPFGVVQGNVLALPEMALPEELDPATNKDVPRVYYNKTQFVSNPNLSTEEVYFHATNRMPAERCYFCHGSHDVAEDAAPIWKHDRDVHMTSGLSCVDCHRNGLDHNMVRGYEGESDDAALATLTCRGCHYGEGISKAMQGRLGAPYPAHKGLPTVHLEKIACTGCHSGPMPAAQAQLVQTARAHALGVHEKHGADPVLPLISSPAFLKGHDGKIAPHYVMYPAFWARVEGDKVTPINPAEVAAAGKEFLPFAKPKQKLQDVPMPTSEQIAKTMAAMNEGRKAEAPEVVYIAGGKLYRLDEKKALVGVVHEAAKPVSWPMGHDVRPVGRALGAGGCSDCHTTTAAIFFSTVPTLSPVKIEEPRQVPMYELQGADGTYWSLFAQSFVFRPMLKTVALACSGIIALVLLAFVVKAVAALCGKFAPSAPRKD